MIIATPTASSASRTRVDFRTAIGRSLSRRRAAHFPPATQGRAAAAATVARRAEGRIDIFSATVTFLRNCALLLPAGFLAAAFVFLIAHWLPGPVAGRVSVHQRLDRGGSAAAFAGGRFPSRERRPLRPSVPDVARSRVLVARGAAVFGRRSGPAAGALGSPSPASPFSSCCFLRRDRSVDRRVEAPFEE